MSDKYSFNLGNKAIELAKSLDLPKPDASTDQMMFVLTCFGKLIEKTEKLEAEMEKQTEVILLAVNNEKTS